MKRINSILLILIIILSLVLPMTNVVYASDEREEIDEVIGESDIDSIFIYGENVAQPTISTTVGDPAFFYIIMGKWQKKDGEKF